MRPKDPYNGPWRRLRLQVLEEEGYRCALCGGRADSVDHIVPLVERPDLRLERSNLRATCTRCNSRRVSARLRDIRRVTRSPAVRRVW